MAIRRPLHQLRLGLAVLIAIATVALVAARFLGERQPIDSAGQDEGTALNRARPSAAAPRAAATELAARSSVTVSPDLARPTAVVPDHPVRGEPSDTGRGAHDVEICGSRGGPNGSNLSAPLSKLAEKGASESAARLFAAMAQSPDPAVRAAGLLGTDRPAELVTAAQYTNDPLVYGFAWLACSLRDSPTVGCALLTPYRLVALDPSNLVSWLWMADDASRIGDEQSLAEAVYRASLAKVIRRPESAFASLTLSAIPADWPSSVAVLASAQVLQIKQRLTLGVNRPGDRAMMSYCLGKSRVNVNVRQICDRLGTLLIEKAEKQRDLQIARTMGLSVGWSDDRLEWLDARQFAYLTADRDGRASAAAKEPGECASFLRWVERGRARALSGEIPYERAKLAASGKTDAEILLQYRLLRAASPR